MLENCYNVYGTFFILFNYIYKKITNKLIFRNLLTLKILYYIMKSVVNEYELNKYLLGFLNLNLRRDCYEEI